MLRIPDYFKTMFISVVLLSMNMYHGKLVTLRALEMSDLEDLMRYFNTLELRRLLGPPIVRSRKYMEQWLQKASAWNPWSDGHLYLAIVEKATGKYLGNAGLQDITFPHNRAELSISIPNPEERGKGYGSDAIQVLLWVGFHILGLNSIYLDALEDNEQAIHVYEKIGFKRVGILRETEYMDGKHKGLLLMDILREEFMKRYPDTP